MHLRYSTYEFFPTSLSSNQFICFGLSEIKFLAMHYKIREDVLKKDDVLFVLN